MKQKIKKIIPIICIVITLAAIIFSSIVWNKYNNIKNAPAKLEICENTLVEQDINITRLENFKVELEEQKADLERQIESLTKENKALKKN